MKWITASTLVLCLCAHAQDSATLTGVVLDPSGAAVPGATLRLTELRRNIPRVATTDQIGLYRFSSLEPGDYSLEVTQTGFSKIGIRTLTLKARDRQNLRLSLELRAIIYLPNPPFRGGVEASDREHCPSSAGDI